MFTIPSMHNHYHCIVMVDHFIRIVVSVQVQYMTFINYTATSEPLISFDNQTEEIANVLILDVAEHQFVLDSLNVTLSIPDNEVRI